MWQNCQTSCKDFDPDSKPDSVLLEKPDASFTPEADKSKNCDYWAKSGECRNRAKYMWKDCQTSCQKVDTLTQL